MSRGGHRVNRWARGTAAAVPDLPGVFAERQRSRAGHAPTVLLIDDDRAVLTAIAMLLRSRGYDVLTAEDGSDALRFLDEHADVDVVVVDILLPDMTGVQVAELIKAKHPNTPVIFATGVGNVGELKGIEENRLLRKPFTEDDLFDKIAVAMAGD